MTGLRRIAVVRGETPAARLVTGAAVSLLTAVGRLVDEVASGDDLTPYAAAILPRSHGWRDVERRFEGPLLVVDADLFSGAPDAAFARLLGGGSTDAVRLRHGHALVPRPLPALTGRPLGEAGPGVAVQSAGRVGYALPVVVSPALRTVRGFWDLAAALETALAALIGEESVVYAEPWPRGFRAARAITCDLDDLEDAAALAPLVASRRPATLFCCADRLDRLGAVDGALEVAAHGDVHRPFAEPATNLARVDRMRTGFRAAGIDPLGFSPPNLVYTSSLAPLFERFAHVRIGYQERALRFHPARVAGGVLTAVSFYPDFMQRYVGAEEYVRLLTRFCHWAAATGALAVPCFHPCIWPEPLPRFLAAPAGAAWEATLADVAAWWQRRARALEAVGAGQGAAPADVVLVRATVRQRLDALAPAAGEEAASQHVRAATRVAVGGRAVRVVPAGATPAAAVEVPLGDGWRALGWLPGALRRSAARALLQVSNKNGLHACFYGELGLSPDVAKGALRLPMVAADEPLMLARPSGGVLRQAARRMLARLGAPGEVTAHA